MLPFATPGALYIILYHIIYKYLYDIIYNIMAKNCVRLRIILLTHKGRAFRCLPLPQQVKTCNDLSRPSRPWFRMNCHEAPLAGKDVARQRSPDITAPDLTQQQIRICHATKLRRQHDQAKKLSFGVTTL